MDQEVRRAERLLQRSGAKALINKQSLLEALKESLTIQVRSEGETCWEGSYIIPRVQVDVLFDGELVARSNWSL